MKTPTRAEASTATKVAGFVAVLAVVFGGAWAAGAQVGPVGAGSEQDGAGHGATHGATPSDDPGESHGDDHGDTGGPAHGSEREGEQSDPATTGGLPGLATEQDGYRMVLADTALEPGVRQLRFSIEGPDGEPVTAYDVEHEKQLHLIVVRRDHDGFQHLHPTLDGTTGTWTTDAVLTPGAWRIFADFTATGGPPLVLGSDLLVPGAVETPESTEEVRTDVVGGYTVEVRGDLRSGEHASLALTVSKDGAPVTDLQPYLGAYGHLVALREGDLAYLHVHPAGEPGDGETAPGPEIDFGVEVPSTGRYHLYLDFRHDDVVRTAHLVLDTDHAH